ncbi:LTA synthase family protein [Clostridium botulinum]|uniref:LTA synthase family protein n=1 Tax=Clostridium botulinum TaxID=1491 RepID=A0ABC8CV73_CLOBO|nr:LTA synthase family protein [Clostridium botulinum]AVQ39586.1 LTA synthase family protein [Clostridium botulinum]
MEKIFCSLYKNIKELLENKFFLTVVIGTFVEYVLFLLILSDGNAVSIDFRSAFLGIPPILIYIAFILIPYSFAFLFNGRGQKVFLIIINIMISVLLIFDLWYYRSYSSFLNCYMFDMVDNLEGLSSSILAMFRTIDLIFIVNPLILVIMFVKDFYNNNDKWSLRKFALLLIVPILYIGYAHIKVDKLGRGYVCQTLFKRTWSQNQEIYNLSPLGYHLFDFHKYREDKQVYNLSDEEKNEIKTYFNSKEKGLTKNNYSGIFKGKNLIVIQVESLENFIINEKVNGQEITPNLNKLLNNSIYFSNYHEQTFSGTTSDGVFVSNNSMFPPIAGTSSFTYPYNDYNSLPKLLKEQKYSTYSMHGEKGNYWNWMVSERHIGFDTCVDISKFNKDEILGLCLSDESFLSQSVKKIENQKEPYYTFMITASSHSPFNIPKDKVKINIPKELKGTKTGAFIEAAHYTDEMIGRFIKELDKKGMMKNTVIAIYGDHEGLHKFFNEETQNLKGIPERWRNNDRRVPLIIYSKDIKGKEIKTNGGQVDFLPTISYLMGIDENKYINTALGRNLLNTNLDYTVLTDKTYRGKEISNEEKKNYIDVIRISNNMIKANYFKGRF